MITCCPECRTRYRIAREKIGPQGARIRCTRCQLVFRVAPPARATDAALPAEATVVASAAQSRAPAEPPTPTPVARAIVAEADAEVAKRIREFLGTWRIDTDVVHDGGEALLRIFRKLPDLVILGGHLPGLGALAVAEIIRRSADTQEVAMIRVAPMDEPVGAPEFDANEILEPGDLPEGLGSLLERLEVGVRPEPPAAAPTATSGPGMRSPVFPKVGSSQPNAAAVPPSASPAPPSPKPTAEPSAAAPAIGTASEDSVAPPASPASRRRPPLSSDPEIAAAERLARIAIADIVLYNEDAFAKAVAQGNAAQALAPMVDEARHMFEQRIPEKIRAQRDFLLEELERRAALHRERSASA